MQSIGTAADLASALERLARLARSLSTAGELSVPAALLLARLVREGPHRLTDLAAQEGISQPGMTQLVTRLERDGLARRTPNLEDRRVVVVEATAAGRALMKRRRAERAEALGRLLGQLDEPDRAAIDRALPALSRLTEVAPTVLGTDRRGAAVAGARR